MTDARVDAQRIANVVRACPVVADLSAGRYGEICTYLPGRRVPGVRIGDDVVQVHVVAVWGPTIGEVADQVRRVVTPLAYGRQVDVSVESLPASEQSTDAPDAGPLDGRPLDGDPGDPGVRRQ